MGANLVQTILDEVNKRDLSRWSGHGILPRDIGANFLSPELSVQSVPEDSIW